MKVNKGTIISLLGMALSGVGAILSSKAGDAKMQEEVRKAVADAMANTTK